MTTFIGIVIALLLSALIIFQWRVVRQAKSIEGQEIGPMTPAVDEKLRERGKVLLYFYSPNCGPCRGMTPRIEAASVTHDNVFKFDVSQSITLARQLRVMATPTTVLVISNRISTVKLGIVSNAEIETLLG